MREAESSSQEGEAHSRIPDLSALPLVRVFDWDDSALANSVRRIGQAINRPGESYAAHGSTPD
jgi:FXSXX-COOH protein